MADREPHPQLPRRKNGREEIRKLLESGDLTVEDLHAVIEEQTRIQTETRAETLATLERTTDKRVSFAEAVKLLEGKLDLEAARTDAVKSHGRWGLVDALVKAGAIKDADEYAALFDKTTISEVGLKKVRESLERGEKVLPIFDAGKMTPDKLFAVLFTEGGVPHYTNTFGLESLAKLRRIDPKDIPNLANLAGKSFEEQLYAFKVAYKKAAPMKPTGARVLFTSDSKVTRTCISSTQDMQAFAKGETSFLDPNADFLRFRAQMDTGLRKIAGRRGDFDGMDEKAYRAFLDKAFADKTIDEYMPDLEKITRYPNYAEEFGHVLRLDCASGVGIVRIFACNPGYAPRDMGSRISLG